MRGRRSSVRHSKDRTTGRARHRKRPLGGKSSAENSSKSAQFENRWPGDASRETASVPFPPRGNCRLSPRQNNASAQPSRGVWCGPESTDPWIGHCPMWCSRAWRSQTDPTGPPPGCRSRATEALSPRSLAKRVPTQKDPLEQRNKRKQSNFLSATCMNNE